MEIKPKNTKKIVIIIAVVILAVIAAIVAGVIIYNQSHGDDATQTEQKSDKKQTDDKKDEDEKSQNNKSDSTDTQSDAGQSTTNDATNGDKTPPRYEGDGVQGAEQLTGGISGISLSGNNLSVRVTIDQYITDANGKCELTLTSPTGATYSYWSELIQNPQSTSCYGWDINTSELGGNVSGHWSATVVVSGDNRSGTFTKEVDL